MRRDSEGYEIRTYRVKWYFRIGTWGGWRHRKDYHIVGIFRVEELIEGD